jgi:hypothetical protein
LLLLLMVSKVRGLLVLLMVWSWWQWIHNIL